MLFGSIHNRMKIIPSGLHFHSDSSRAESAEYPHQLAKYSAAFYQQSKHSRQNCLDSCPHHETKPLYQDHRHSDVLKQADHF